MANTNGANFLNDAANPTGLIKEINNYFKENNLPMLIVSYNPIKQTIICEMTLPEEVNITSPEVNLKFNHLLRSYSNFGID